MEIKIDAVGRIDVPKKVRTLLHWQGGDRLRLSVDEETGTITLKKMENRCLCCGSQEELTYLGEGVNVCRRCIIEKCNR